MKTKSLKKKEKCGEAPGTSTIDNRKYTVKTFCSLKFKYFQLFRVFVSNYHLFVWSFLWAVVESSIRLGFGSVI